MYLKHYHLTSKPFAISPDPKFLWLGKKHREALAAMKYGILDNKGFISLTGDVGTGKTTLINALSNSLADNIIFALVPEPAMEQLDFLNMTADAFKMNKKFSTKGEFLNHLKHFLNDAYVHHKEVVLVIEEAQRFDQDRLEEVRLISNIEKPDRKLINVVFVGQNEFNSILIKNKALRQRISIIHNIGPLQEIETDQYIKHRLKIAGSERKIFNTEAVREIYSFSEGNPRLINIICDLALLTGYANDKKIIGPDIIRECAANSITPKQQKEDSIVDLRTSSTPVPLSETRLHPARSGSSYQIVAKKKREKPARFKLAYIPPLFMVIMLSIFGSLYFIGENHTPYRDFKAFLGQTFKPFTGSKLENSSLKPDEIEKLKEEIAVLRDQLLALKLQKASSDTQPGQMITRNAEFAASLNELKGAKERVALLEGMAARREQMLSQSEQKVTDLTDGLDREKKSQELLRADLATKADLVAELQQKLEATLASQSVLENDIEEGKKDILKLQAQLLDLKAQKASSDTQLGQMRTRNEALTADLEDLKATTERVVALEGEVASKDQALSGAEQRLSQLAKELDLEKQSGERLSTKISTKVNLIADLQNKLANAQSNAMEFEAEINNSTIKINELQEQLKGLKSQQAPAESSKEIAALQEQISELKAQKATSDTQLEQLRSRNEGLQADLAELKVAKERVAALEEAAARREQTLTASTQQVKDLTSVLDREKKGQEKLSAELSTKANLVSELQQKLEATLSSRSKLEDDIEKNKTEITTLQEQLLNAKVQKGTSDDQIEQLRSSNQELSADLKELKDMKELVPALEGELATTDQALSGSEQRRSQLAKELDQEKKSRERLSSELSTKVDLIAELQEKLGTAQSKVLAFEAEIENNTIKIGELEKRLKERSTQRASTESSTVKEIEVLRGQLLDLKAQKASSDTQQEQLKSRNEALTSDLADLKRAKERVAELEQVAARREQTFSASEQKVAELQSQITDLKAQKASSDTQLGQLRSRYEAITADLNEAKGAKKRVAALEGELAMKDQTLSRSEKQLSQLAKELDQEKKSRELLRSEISKKADLVSAFQQKLQTSQADQQALEETLNQSKKEIAELQNQIGEIQSQPSQTRSALPTVDMKETSTLKSEAYGKQVDSPSPSDIIDWILKKKAK